MVWYGVVVEEMDVTRRRKDKEWGGEGVREHDHEATVACVQCLAILTVHVSSMCFNWAVMVLSMLIQMHLQPPHHNPSTCNVETFTGKEQ